MLQIRIFCVALWVLLLCFVSPLALAAQSSSAEAKTAAPADTPAQKTSKQSSSAKGKPASHARVDHLGAELGAGSAWYLDGAPRAGRGAVWERGIPMETLSRKRAGAKGATGAPVVKGAARAKGDVPTQAPQGAAVANKGGVDTTKGIDSALGNLSSYERQPADGSALGLGKPGSPSLQVTKEESSWHNPVTQSHTTGQDVMTTRRNVVGAYADVVKNDDLRVTVGPELHIPETDPSVGHVAPQQKDTSSVGFGMKWQWDF